MDIQLKKGFIEFCVLAILEKSDSYGYQIIKDISDCIQMSESTLYPLLRRMEMAGNVTSYSKEYNNRLRRYYHLTEEGQDYLNTFRHDKNQIIDILDFIG